MTERQVSTTASVPVNYTGPSPSHGRSASVSRRRRQSSWRELLAFRGAARPRLEIGIGIGAFLLVVVVWDLITRSGLIKPQFLPSPGAVVMALSTMLTTADYTRDVGISIARVWIAFLASVVIAVPLGILMSSYRASARSPSRSSTSSAICRSRRWCRLTLIWLGIGESSKIALLWIGTFFQLVLLVADDARRVPKEFIETGRTLGARQFPLMKDVLFPAMLPNMVDSLRITLGWCWTYLIVAEIVAANSGIGYELWTARRYGKTPEVFAGILTIGIIGLVSDQMIRVLHRRWFRYLTT